MVGEGSDWNSSSTTVTTPWLLSHGWWKFWCIMAPTFHTKIERVQTDSAISQHLNPSNLSSLVWRKVRHGWDWYMGAEMVTTTYFPALRGYKFGLAQSYFSNPDCVGADWFRQFTTSQPFQCVIISIMNDLRRWRLEFILHHRHHTPAFESGVMKILVVDPTFHTKIESEETDSAISQHLNPSNLSS